MAVNRTFVSYFWLVYHSHQLWQSFLGLKEVASVCLRYKTTIMLHRPWRPLMSKKVWQSRFSKSFCDLAAVCAAKPPVLWLPGSERRVYRLVCQLQEMNAWSICSRVLTWMRVLSPELLVSDRWISIAPFDTGRFVINAVRISFWFVSIIHSPYLTWNRNWFSWNISGTGQIEVIVK